MANIADMVDRKSDEYRANHEALAEKVADLGARIARIAEGGGAVARQRHQRAASFRRASASRRSSTAVRPSTSELAAADMYGDEIPAAGIFTGIGRIEGRECVIIANDATVKGGSYYPMTVKKHLRAQEIAAKNALPCVSHPPVHSGGANLPNQDEVFPDRDHFGRIFYNQANLSARGIPQIAVVMGSCTAGGAYVPAMADQSMVRNQATIFSPAHPW